MFGQFEEKGKIYTPVVSTEPLDVVISTNKQRIQGTVYIRHGERLKDQIDRNERYLAVTNAKIYDLDGVLLYSVGFLAVNHDNILWITPLSEINASEENNHE
ncbi:MAG TPA: hypothetical protein VFF78_02490 [Anaerolineaceae bacterium]|nr:hypothetical protein [Anaerolineaceae bacterium]